MLCATAIGENAKEKNFARSDFSAPIAEEIVKTLRPHEKESQRSRHLPETQERGSGQGTAGEQVSGRQLPPGKGLPKVPWEQAQVGPLSAMMH